MRVLFQTRFNVFERKGGDTVQLLKTKEYIEKLFPKISIDIHNDPNIDLEPYDLVHIFNLLRPQEGYLYIKNAKKQNKKVVLSTIYWKSKEFEQYGQIGLRRIINKFLNYNQIERIRALYRYYIDGEKHEGTSTLLKIGFQELQKYIVLNSDLLLPNGKGEIELLRKELKLNKIPDFIVAPNAIDKEIFNNKIYMNSTERKIVLCVGRIEPRKNQLNLVRAMEGLPYELLLVGKAHRTQKSYFYKVLKATRKLHNVRILDEMDQDKLSKVYNEAKVHALPSWYDTPGLVSLEAAVKGCNIVVTNRGTTEEYFDSNAYYCEPNNIESIRRAIEKAYYSRNDEKLKEKILRNYTWENTAKKTVEGYMKLLSKVE